MSEAVTLTRRALLGGTAAAVSVLLAEKLAARQAPATVVAAFIAEIEPKK